jgi:YD repeat-containing protein
LRKLQSSWVYEYDRGGNIISKKKYAYTTGALGAVQQTIAYEYGNAKWKDQLTRYNGKAITYDAIGNPLSYNGWTYEWQAGRQLKKMSKSGTTAEYTYDHNGLRVRKVVNGVATEYMLHGKLVTGVKKGNEVLKITYDAQSRPAMVKYNGTWYGYVHNLQGDIVGILDNTGAEVVKYTYDAWGKVMSVSGSKAGTLGKANPFRYRGVCVRRGNRPLLPEKPVL